MNSEVAFATFEAEEVIWGGVVVNPRTPVDVIVSLAQFARTAPQRAALAAHPNAPAELLERLAADKLPDVRRQAARNTTTPLDVLDELSMDTDASVRAMVYLNPAASESARVQAGLLGLVDN
ncbi:MAG: hypothetical protein WCP26_12905 [Actinomycetes bacterium]